MSYYELGRLTGTLLIPLAVAVIVYRSLRKGRRLPNGDRLPTTTGRRVAATTAAVGIFVVVLGGIGLSRLRPYRPPTPSGDAARALDDAAYRVYRELRSLKPTAAIARDRRRSTVARSTAALRALGTGDLVELRLARTSLEELLNADLGLAAKCRARGHSGAAAALDAEANCVRALRTMINAILLPPSSVPNPSTTPAPTAGG